MFTFPTDTLSAARRGLLATVSREWLRDVAAGAFAYPTTKYHPTAHKILRQLERQPDRTSFYIAYGSHRQRRTSDDLARRGKDTPICFCCLDNGCEWCQPA